MALIAECHPLGMIEGTNEWVTMVGRPATAMTAALGDTRQAREAP